MTLSRMRPRCKAGRHTFFCGVMGGGNVVVNQGIFGLRCQFLKFFRVRSRHMYGHFKSKMLK